MPGTGPRLPRSAREAWNRCCPALQEAQTTAALVFGFTLVGREDVSKSTLRQERDQEEELGLHGH